MLCFCFSELGLVSCWDQLVLSDYVPPCSLLSDMISDSDFSWSGLIHGKNLHLGTLHVLLDAIGETLHTICDSC
jgi:hypothetical protein